tara:strand:- start:3034 stop:3159 length:126 start_codon:yes stop_codon:yes gene_type:complete
VNEWFWVFIPLWFIGFMIGLHAQKINRWLDEPKAFVLKDEK